MTQSGGDLAFVAAQRLAARGRCQCRACNRESALAAPDVISVWCGGALVFAICARCTRENEVALTAVEHGVEVRTRARQLVIPVPYAPTAAAVSFPLGARGRR